MRLLVSVSGADEARAAALGGADIIDAKDPSAGALGAVRPDVLSDIRRAVGPNDLVTAALGDADASGAVERLARELVARGARLVKVGFGGVLDPGCVADLIGRVVDATAGVDSDTGVVAVAYADAAGTSIDATTLVSIAARSRARGVLVDTADKCGPGLIELWSSTELASWISRVHGHGLFAAVAGKLGVHDLGVVADAGADIAGVRGAACVGGRAGRVSAERVRSLRDALTIADRVTDGDGHGAPAHSCTSTKADVPLL